MTEPMSTTTISSLSATRTLDGTDSHERDRALVRQYESFLRGGDVSWTRHYHFLERIGSGGQGVVYLAVYRGADGFSLPVAAKAFSPARYANDHAYSTAMRQIAAIAMRAAAIQNDHLVSVQNFTDVGGVRLLIMEWLDGYDLSRLLTDQMLRRTRDRMSQRRWQHLNHTTVTDGTTRPRLRAEVSFKLLTDCLDALAALDREGIVHGDIKPSNIMLKRSGAAKVIDLGTAFHREATPPVRTWTPKYAAPEVLEGALPSHESDLASLGYVFIEMLCGDSLFEGIRGHGELVCAKRDLNRRLRDVLPAEVARDGLLFDVCRTLTAPDPTLRSAPDAEEMTALRGAAAYHRLLRRAAFSDCQEDLRIWLEGLA